MTSYKRIDGDYYIQTINPGDRVYIDTHEVDITGNLKVSGNVTYIDVTELNVTDPFIVLNSSNTSTYEANSGVLTHITSSTFAGIRYSNDSGVWELSVDTSSTGETGTWSPIVASGSIAAGANTEIQYNNGGALGANAAFSFDYATSIMGLDGVLQLGYAIQPASAIPSTATVTANAVGSGGSGLYFTNDGVEDELVSKSKAIVYSIIF